MPPITPHYNTELGSEPPPPPPPSYVTGPSGQERPATPTTPHYNTELGSDEPPPPPPSSYVAGPSGQERPVPPITPHYNTELGSNPPPASPSYVTGPSGQERPAPPTTPNYNTELGSDVPPPASSERASNSGTGRGVVPPPPPDPREELDLRQVRKEAAKSPQEQQLEKQYYGMGGDEALVEQLTRKWQADVQALRQQLKSQGKTEPQIAELVRSSELARPENLPRAKVARMSLREKYSKLQVRRA